MGRVFRFLMLGLVLVLVFLGAAMTAMRFAIHGSETSVPAFVGLSQVDAERLATATGLVLVYEGRFYSTDIPEGRIVSQFPAAGEKVRQGWRVRLAQSLGTQRVTIPDVVGQSQRAAEINLQRRGLEIGSVARIRITGVPASQIVAQSPAAGDAQISSPKVNLLQTALPEDSVTYYVMPSFVGRRFGDASSAMAEAGLHLGAIRVLTDGTPNPRIKPVSTDIIVQQSLAAGQKVGEGATLGFDVAR